MTNGSKLKEMKKKHISLFWNPKTRASYKPVIPSVVDTNSESLYMQTNEWGMNFPQGNWLFPVEQSCPGGEGV
jgi:hypothetical protein